MAPPSLIQNFLNILSSAQPRLPLVSRTTTIAGMDSYSDSTTLSEGTVQLSQNMRLLKNVAYTREGWTKYNTSVLPTSSGVLGLGVYLPTLDVACLLAVSDGKLYSGASGVFTQRYTGLNTTNLCTIVQVQDVALVIDQASRLLVYKYGVAPYFAGVNSPATYNLLSSFEANETWVVVNGTQAPDTGHVIHGKQSIVFVSNVGATMTVSRTFTTPFDLTAFLDGSASDDHDYIRIDFLRGDPATFTSCTLYLGDVGFANSFHIDLATVAAWTGDTRVYVDLDLKVRKSAFASVGAPNWNNIAAAKIVVITVAATQASMSLDFFTHFKTGPIAVDSGVGGNLNGAYYYKVTFLTENDDESEASLPSDIVTVTNHSVNLTLLPLSGDTRIVRRRLYRIGGTTTLWNLVYQFENNTQTAYTDNVDDTDVGAAFVDVAGPPYTPKAICVHGNYVIIANLTSPDGLYYPCGVMVSREGSYEVFNPLDFFEIEPKGGSQIIWVHSEFGLVYVGKEDSVWSFDPAHLDVPPRCESRLYGGAASAAVASGENCFYYLDKLAVVQCNGASHVDISNPAVRNFLELIPATWMSRVWMKYYDHTLYLGVPQQVIQQNVVDLTSELVIDVGSDQVIESYTPLTDFILVFYAPTQRWYTFLGWGALTAATSPAPAFGRHLYLGSSSQGFVYDALTGDTDDGIAIESILHFKDSDFGEPETLKDFTKWYVTGAKLTAANVTLTITPYLNKVAAGVEVSEALTTLTSLDHNLLEVPAPAMGAFGTYLGVKIAASGRWTFRSLVQVVKVREATY